MGTGRGLFRKKEYRLSRSILEWCRDLPIWRYTSEIEISFHTREECSRAIDDERRCANLCIVAKSTLVREILGAFPAAISVVLFTTAKKNGKIATDETLPDRRCNSQIFGRFITGR